MNPHTEYSHSPKELIRSLWTHRQLIKKMIWREVVGRYKGSTLGLSWSFFNPLMMLAVYTFVFSVVFQSRWGVDTSESKADFAIVLFAGLAIHMMFSEALNRAPNLILSNINYVKKVVFPLEILPIISIGSALFHAIISFSVLTIAFAIFNGFIHWTIILAPLTIGCILPLTLGISWILASLGVYLRDISQLISIITTVLLFLAPVFYPKTMLPDLYQTLLNLNPITLPITQTRNVMIFGQTPDWGSLALYTIISLAVCWLGYWWFQKTRKGFADVL